jgi:predicted transcriptional regulator
MGTEQTKRAAVAVLAVGLAFAQSVFAQRVTRKLEANAPLPSVTLADDAGGYLDGKPWKSSDLVGKACVLFYVDPDCSDQNEAFTEALRERAYPGEGFATFAVINMAATWKPNFVISKVLKAKQKRYPRTRYVEDRDRALVKAWDLADNAYVVVVLDREGRVRYHTDKELDERRIREVIGLLDELVATE